MKHLFSLCICFLLFFNFATAQIPIGKTVMEYQIERGGQTLTMNGGGTRSMLFIDLYSAGLYLQEKSHDPIAISYKNETMSIRIKITSKLVSRKTMISAIRDGFEKATSGQTEAIQDRIELVNKYYAKEFKKDDILELIYIKDKGTICMLNEKELGIIKGQDFKFALYKIWLGEDPASKSLKKGMLAI